MSWHFDKRNDEILFILNKQESPLGQVRRAQIVDESLPDYDDLRDENVELHCDNGTAIADLGCFNPHGSPFSENFLGADFSSDDFIERFNTLTCTSPTPSNSTSSCDLTCQPEVIAKDAISESETENSEMEDTILPHFTSTPDRPVGEASTSSKKKRRRLRAGECSSRQKGIKRWKAALQVGKDVDDCVFGDASWPPDFKQTVISMRKLLLEDIAGKGEVTEEHVKEMRTYYNHKFAIPATNTSSLTLYYKVATLTERSWNAAKQIISRFENGGYHKSGSLKGKNARPRKRTIKASFFHFLYKLNVLKDEEKTHRLLVNRLEDSEGMRSQSQVSSQLQTHARNVEVTKDEKRDNERLKEELKDTKRSRDQLIQQVKELCKELQEKESCINNLQLELEKVKKESRSLKSMVEYLEKRLDTKTEELSKAENLNIRVAENMKVKQKHLKTTLRRDEPLNDNIEALKTSHSQRKEFLQHGRRELDAPESDIRDSIGNKDDSDSGDSSNTSERKSKVKKSKEKGKEEGKKGTQNGDAPKRTTGKKNDKRSGREMDASIEKPTNDEKKVLNGSESLDDNTRAKFQKRWEEGYDLEGLDPAYDRWKKAQEKKTQIMSYNEGKLSLKEKDVVAVAYENTYYLGSVKCLFPTEVEVEFMKKTSGSSYKFIKNAEVEKINPIYIFSKPAVTVDSKMVTLMDRERVKIQYQDYKTKYFK